MGGSLRSGEDESRVSGREPRRHVIETGKYDPSLPLAFKQARLFETTIEAIFSDEK